MLRPLFTWFVLLVTAALLSACCGSVACDCNDEYADALFLRFDTLATTGFTRPELQAVYLVRTLINDTARVPARDTVALSRTLARAYDPVIINNNTPFVQSSGRKVDRYGYQLLLGTRRTPTFRFVVDSTNLDKKYQADGCCTCYQNTKKEVYLNGSRTPFVATAPSGENTAVYIPVRR